MPKRRRFKQIETFTDRLATFANLMRERASLLPSGIEKEELLSKARRADTAAHMNDWVNSPGLQPPK